MLGRSLESLPGSAGHNACYISTCGEFYPCGQLPLSGGNARQQRFIAIWGGSEQPKEVPSIRRKDRSGGSQCAHGSSCTRRPGLAFMEGNLRGPSTADCEKSFARAGIPWANLLTKKDKAAAPRTGADSARTGDHGRSALWNGRPLPVFWPYRERHSR
jgi:hypothetical protein